MLQTVIPQGYAPCLNLYDTQKAIGLLKRLFEDTLGGALHLRRVSAPLFVEASTGLNDDLNGVERAVSFDIPDAGRDAQVVHSLAKWKRMALYRYQFSVGEGLYTDMNAIRRDEELDNLHSVYVDQWDWEKIIAPRDRNADYLRQTVRTIVSAMAETQHTLRSVFPQLTALPPLGTEVSFVTTQELEELWPDRSPKVSYLFEASVGGGIPIIRPLNQCLAANEIEEITGILNGTTHPIPPRMIPAGLTFEQALKEAQENGYAERDPSADVDGHDACRKICILASLAFGRHIYPRQVPTEGITGVTLADVAYADSWGKKLKLLGRAIRRTDGKVCAYVAPHLVDRENPLSGVEDVFNAIAVRGNAIGDVMF